MTKQGKDFWCAFANEATYASGNGAIRTATVLGQGNLYAISKAKSMKFPDSFNKWEPLQECNAGELPSSIEKAGIERKNGEFEFFCQEDKWFVLAFANVAGDVPTSKAAHFYNGHEHREAFGMQIEKYVLNIDADPLTLPTETVTFKHHSTKYGAAGSVAALTKVATLTSECLRRRKFNIQVDGENTLQVKKCKLTVDRVLTDDVLEDNQDTPYQCELVEKKVTLDLTVKSLGTNTLTDIFNTSKQDETVLIDGVNSAGTKIYGGSLAGLYFDPKEQNTGEIEKHGSKDWNLKLVHGNNFVFTDTS